MINKINRAIKDFLRPKRISLGRMIWDKKIGVNKCFTENIIESNNIKSILFLRYDGKIGDMIINTLIFRELKKKFPYLHIGVVTRGAARDIIANSPWVNEIYNYDKNFKKISELASRIRGNYDLLVDFNEYLRVYEMSFIKNCGCPFNMGLDKANWNLFNINLVSEKDFSYKDHITKRYGAYLKKLGVSDFNFEYDIFINNERENSILSYYEKVKNSSPKTLGYFILNPYGASKHKNFNFETLKNISMYIESLGYSTILVYSPDKFDELNKFYNEVKKEIPTLILPEGIKSILDSAAIIQHADFVITPDTSIVHIASAFNKPMVAVYPPNGGAFGVDHLVWGPLDSENPVIFCKDAQSDIEKFDINTFSMDEMKESINKIIGKKIERL